MTFVEALQILAALERHGVAYVLVGSMAMAAHGIVRATRDMDIFVSPDESNVARLKGALMELFGDPELDSISSAELSGDYPAIQYVPPSANYWIDILSRLGEAFRYPDVECEILRVEGVSVRVATPRMLYRMKKDTVRPQDRVDAQVLRERFALRTTDACELTDRSARCRRRRFDGRSIRPPELARAVGDRLRLAPARRLPPGVHRYRSIAAACEGARHGSARRAGSRAQRRRRGSSGMLVDHATADDRSALASAALTDLTSPRR
jgi:hypothetical protein